VEIKLPTLIATSVVRGSQQGESHGGIYVVDFERRSGQQHVDWNDSSIDFEGRGADRGLRGIAFDDDDIFVAASDELYRYNQAFEIQESFRNRYLKHCHEICRLDNRLFLTSTGFDCILAFNLDTGEFDWGFQLQRALGKWSGYTFDPRAPTGPAPVNDFHINMVHVDASGIFLSGLKTGALLRLNRKWDVSIVCELPPGTHNARPWRDGVLFNDTAADCVRYADRNGAEKAFKIITYDESEVQFAGVDDSNIARQGFGRGLTVFQDRFVIGGSSPSTITIYDLDSNQTVGSVNLSMDIRNAIHGLEVWPYST
tara:strand:- start:255 stop:1193 length:939 start_codon:yes stop_codon:yes gene_type:complete